MSFYSPKSWVKEIAHVQLLTRLNQKHNSSARNAPLSGCCFNKANICLLGPQVWTSQDIIAERDGFNQLWAGNRICIRRKWRDFNEETTRQRCGQSKGTWAPRDLQQLGVTATPDSPGEFSGEGKVPSRSREHERTQPCHKHKLQPGRSREEMPKPSLLLWSPLVSNPMRSWDAREPGWCSPWRTWGMAGKGRD